VLQNPNLYLEYVAGGGEMLWMKKLRCYLGIHNNNKGTSFLYIIALPNGRLKKMWFIEKECTQCKHHENAAFRDVEFRNKFNFIHISNVAAYMYGFTPYEIAAYNRTLWQICKYEGKIFKGLRCGRPNNF
jgi:hypothetical protein